MEKIIEYSIPTVETTRRVVFTTLKVYDILGREIETIVNEYQLPGNIRYNLMSERIGDSPYKAEFISIHLSFEPLHYVQCSAKQRR
ncbi:MAG: hypothetical protein AB1521_05710 [Bacteroidota bacterium]